MRKQCSGKILRCKTHFARDDSATLERFAPAWGELLVRAVEGVTTGNGI